MFGTVMVLSNKRGTMPHIRRTIAQAVIVLMIAAAFILAAPAHPADAAITETENGFVVTASDFYIPRPATASDQVGVERVRSTDTVPAEYVGLTCGIVVGAANGASVHGDNYGIVYSNGDSVLVEDTEDQPNVVRTTQSDRRITLGATMTVVNIMVEDAAGTVGTSVDYVVTVDCTQQVTTTTTTQATTTTTGGDTTTTTAPNVTTTTGGDATTTTGPDISTTTTPDGSTTTTPDESTTTIPPVETPPTLPFTGPEDYIGMAMAAAALLLLGAALVFSMREVAE